MNTHLSQKDIDWIGTLLKLFGSYKAILLDVGYDPLEVTFMSEEKAKKIIWEEE